LKTLKQSMALTSAVIGAMAVFSRFEAESSMRHSVAPVILLRQTIRPKI